jgi:hypothetical protein
VGFGGALVPLLGFSAVFKYLLDRLTEQGGLTLRVCLAILAERPWCNIDTTVEAPILETLFRIASMMTVISLLRSESEG